MRNVDFRLYNGETYKAVKEDCGAFRAFCAARKSFPLCPDKSLSITMFTFTRLQLMKRFLARKKSTELFLLEGNVTEDNEYSSIEYILVLLAATLNVCKLSQIIKPTFLSCIIKEVTRLLQ